MINHYRVSVNLRLILYFRLLYAEAELSIDISDGRVEVQSYVRQEI